MTNTPSDETIVLSVLRSAVSERVNELTTPWRKHGYEIMVAPNAKESKIDATIKRITFNTKTIDYFGFSASTRGER